MMLVEIYVKSSADILFTFNGYFPSHGLNLVLYHEKSNTPTFRVFMKSLLKLENLMSISIQVYT